MPKRTPLVFSLLLLVGACAANPREVPDTGPRADGGGPVLDDGDVPLVDGETPPPPRDGSTCTGGEDLCTLGETRCSGLEIQTCEVDGSTGCAAWSAAAACEGELFCSADECTDTCVDACTESEQRCSSGAGFQVCETQASGCLDWSPEEACGSDEVCAGAGACMACTDGDTRCGATGVEECAGGRWTAVEGCPFGCTAGMCDESVTCTPSAYRCRGDNVESCNSSGSAWLHVRTCSVSCSAGLCTGACTPGETRCNGGGVETCNAGGTAWDVTETCTTFCARGGCALDGLEVASNTTLEGEIFVDGDVIVRSGFTVTSSTGELTIHADSITVENGASISVAPTGQTPEGQGSDGYYYSYYGYYYGGRGGDIWSYTSASDAIVGPGARGGDGLANSAMTTPGTGGLGGGVLRLLAPSITIAGQLTANGQNGSTGGVSGGGGGSGGGILIAGSDVVVSGTISAIGGGGAVVSGSNRSGTDGGQGRIKILHGTALDETGSTITGAITRGLLPPIEIASSTHPDPDLVYNDGFPVVGMSWNRPYSPLTGYYWLEDTTEIVPSPANAEFVASEIVSFGTEDLTEGANYFQIVSVNGIAEVGAIEGVFRIQLNRTPPTITSSSHASGTTWSANRNAFFSWTFPHADENYQGVHYVLDHFGDTIPTTSDSFVAVSQKQLLSSGLADGIWVFHVVSVDTQGYLTNKAHHYQVRIGEDPGSGTVFGQVTDSTTSTPIASATVSVNRGVFPDQATNGTGNFNFPEVSDGTWELRVAAPGYQTATQMITVMDGMSTAANVSLVPEAP